MNLYRNSGYGHPRIINVERKRIKRGIPEYLLKWKSSTNVVYKTWESGHTLLSCINLVAEFESRTKIERLNKIKENLKYWKVDGGVDISFREAVFDVSNNLPGFDQGLEPQRIVHSAKRNGEIMFLMIWKNSDTSDFVRRRDARVLCPELVIDYYEKCITWIR